MSHTLQTIFQKHPYASFYALDAKTNIIAAKYDLGETVKFEEFAARQVPAKMATYVPFGHFDAVKSIVESWSFTPTMITGLSGNGKTQMVQEVCAQTMREFIRVNITSDTDEDDLIGGFRIQTKGGDGGTFFALGPVAVAMMRGAVLLLDEIDLGTNKVMCLQAVLEGKPLFIKKIGQYIYPAPGFQIFATANTKGQGDQTGKFAHTQIMNEAMLERFVITMEQEYPPDAIEKRILALEMKELGLSNKNNLIERLVKWGNQIRQSFDSGAVQDLITTRRLVNIVRMLAVFGDNEDMCIKYGISRFDKDTQDGFLTVWKKLIPTPSKSASSPTSVKPTVDIDLTSSGAKAFK